MINVTRGDFQPQSESKITCCSKNTNKRSKRIERYLVEARKHSSTQPCVSEPISCPPPPPLDDECYDQQMSMKQSTEYYNARTWNMYYRIMQQHCRKGDNKSSCSASCLSRGNDNSSDEKASRRGSEESLGKSNSGTEEIFQLEL